jgi:hypothetical protein
LLLAEKLKSTDEILYKQQIQKLSLYFTNPLWLDYQVNGYKTHSTVEPADNRTEIVDSEAIQKQQVIEIPREEGAPVGASESLQPSAVEIQHESQTPLAEAAATVDADQDNVEIENLQTVRESETAQTENMIPIEEVNTTNEQEQTLEMENLEVPEPTHETVETLEGRPDESTEMAPVQTPEDTSTVHDQLPDDEVEPHENNVEPPDLHVSIPSLPDINQELSETELTFEPYHTVDYFASQGIKFVPEEKPADRFGQQLRSFTEWLKTLKRLPETDVKIPDEASEEKVKQLADHSISKDEVVTETMAEVWLKQGNKEKAIETYNKLSLLNPDKSAYFASLIEQLQNS